MLMTRDKSFYKEFFSLYWVFVLQDIIILSVNLADNIMIGGYSETALSGVAAVNQIQFVFQQFAHGCGDGLVVIASQYWGQGRTDAIKRLSFSALLLSAAVGLTLFVTATVAPEWMVGLFTTSPEIIAEGVRYLDLIKYTYLVFALTNVLIATLRSVETVRVAFYISISTLIINCSLNYILIEGRFGAPQLGVYGAAIGTLAARVVELVIIVLYVIFADHKLQIRLPDYLRLDKKLFADYCKVSWPIVLVSGMFGISTALQTVVLGHMSDSAIAANSMATSLYQTLKVIAIAASTATSVIIGKTVGMGDRTKIREYTRTFQVLFLAIGAVMSISLFFLRAPILSLYDLSPETKQMANAFLLVLCVTGFGTAYEMPTLCGIVRGGGDSKFILFNDAISIWGIVLPLSFLAAFWFKWSPVAVVFCLNSDQLFKCIAAAVKANNYTWIKKLTREA